MNVLVDTSVWVDHFKNSNTKLRELLNQDNVLSHPMIIGELACGTTPPAPRTRTLNDIKLLKMANQVNFNEVLGFIERDKIYGMGCGFVDISLLASALITPDAMLWTLDKRLSKLAKCYNISYLNN